MCWTASSSWHNESEFFRSYGYLGKYSFPECYPHTGGARLSLLSWLMVAIPHPGYHMNFDKTSSECVKHPDNTDPDILQTAHRDAQKTKTLHHSCFLSWFISSVGYFYCQSVANCQCNVLLTAALHTFPSPRWPMLNSIFKYRGFETAYLCKKMICSNKDLGKLQCKFLVGGRVCIFGL